MYPDSSLPSGEMGLMISSFLPSRRGSLRVATTVPTTRANILSFRRLLAGVLRLRLADGQNVFQALMRARNDVYRDQLADAPRSRGSGVGGGAHCRHVSAHQ